MKLGLKLLYISKPNFIAGWLKSTLDFELDELLTKRILNLHRKVRIFCLAVDQHVLLLSSTNLMSVNVSASSGCIHLSVIETG